MLIRNKEQRRVRYPQMVSNTDRIQIFKSVHLTSLLNFEWLTIENLKFFENFLLFLASHYKFAAKILRVPVSRAYNLQVLQGIYSTNKITICLTRFLQTKYST